jgi:hypothetical protein
MFGTLIPIFGMITGILVTGGIIYGVIRVMHSPVGIALARKIQGSHGEADEELRAEVTYLRDQVEDVQRQLGETQERLDFAERILSRHKQASQLPGEL